MYGIVLIVVTLICCFIIDKNIFILLNIIKFSLIGTLPLTALISFFSLCNNVNSIPSYKYIFVVNIIQIIYWYAIELI